MQSAKEELKILKQECAVAVCHGELRGKAALMFFLVRQSFDSFNRLSPPAKEAI